MTIKAVLFDLDGTLLDTAPDLAYTLNELRKMHGLTALPIEAIRPVANLGSKAMLKIALNIDETDPHFQRLRQEFFNLYQTHLSRSTRFFPQIETVLAYLDKHEIPWGIVTNKLTHHTTSILNELKLTQRIACLVCGDTLEKAKPNPEPILHACWLMQCEPHDCVYIGDAITDVYASKAAGTATVVALYGYHGNNEDPLTWQADAYIREPIEMIDWLKTNISFE